MYADDTDLYLIFKPSELTENVAEMERTSGLVRRWMSSNELKMNDAKTEVMLITPRRMAMKIECPTVVIGDHVVAPSHFVRNLGVILDSLAGMERQINVVCKTSYMHLQHKQDSVLLGQTLSGMHNPCICHVSARIWKCPTLRIP